MRSNLPVLRVPQPRRIVKNLAQGAEQVEKGGVIVFFRAYRCVLGWCDDKWLGVMCGNILLTSLNIQTKTDGKPMRIMPDHGTRSQGHPRPRPQGGLQFTT